MNKTHSSKRFDGSTVCASASMELLFSLGLDFFSNASFTISQNSYANQIKTCPLATTNKSFIMSSRILTFKLPDGRVTLQTFNETIRIADVLLSICRKFNLKRQTYNVKLATENVDLDQTIRGANIPETACLKICGREENPLNDRLRITVEICFADEDKAYGTLRKAMNTDANLWTVVEEMLPETIPYEEDGISLTYLRQKYTGKSRLENVKISDICTEHDASLLFICDRNFQLSKNRRTSLTGRETIQRCDSSNDSASLPANLGKVSQVEFRSQLSSGIIELGERCGKFYRNSDFDADSISCGSYPSSLWALGVRKGNQEIPVTIIFPNSIALEASFSLDEKIEDVVNFAKNFLHERAKNRFFLYTLKPRLIAKSETKLKDMRTCPRWCLWFCGTHSGDLFAKNIAATLNARAFKCTLNCISSQNDKESGQQANWTPNDGQIMRVESRRMTINNMQREK